MREPTDETPENAERAALEHELLQYHFGCHPNPEPLEARLADDPELQAIHLAVLAKAEMLNASAQPAPMPPQPTPFQWWFALRTPWGRVRAVSTIAAAVLAAVVVLAGWSNKERDAFMAAHLSLSITAPLTVPAGMPWQFAVQANDLSGRPSQAEIAWTAMGAGDVELSKGECSLLGHATVAVPADLRAVTRVLVHATQGADAVEHAFALDAAAIPPLVQLTTDRPVYRPGETVYVRALLLDRLALTPRELGKKYVARLRSSAGTVVAERQDAGEPTQPAAAGVRSFLFALPNDCPGGKYTLELAAAGAASPTTTTDLVVRPFRSVDLRSEIVLDRASYLPGGRGGAQVTLSRLQGSLSAQASVQASIVLNGKEYWRATSAVDAQGRAKFAFEVPRDCPSGAARWLATASDGADVEVRSQTFVIGGDNCQLALFPEGGVLVAGVENRVYFECTDAVGRPCDGSGVLVDDQQQVVAKFSSAHLGRGQLRFVPEVNRRYAARIAGAPEVALRAAEPMSTTIASVDAEVAAAGPLRMQVLGKRTQAMVLAVFCRGLLVGQLMLPPSTDGSLATAAEVPLLDQAQGVLRVTLFTADLQAIAERLVHRAAARRMQVTLTPLHAELSPGGSQELTVQTRDELGQPCAAVIGLTVADMGALAVGEEPRIGLADMASLFTDVEQLEHRSDFLAANAPAHHTDLLLGTRGWRRFFCCDVQAAQQTDPRSAFDRAAAGLSPMVQSRTSVSSAGSMLDVFKQRSASLQSLRDSTSALTLAVLLTFLLLESASAAFRRGGARRPLLLGATVVVTLLLTVLVLAPNTLGARDLLAPSAAVELAGVWQGEDIEPTAADFTPEIEQRPPLVTADVVAPSPVPPTTQRVYAHQHPFARMRSDFAPTIYWTAYHATDASGVARVTFDTSDAVTTWQAYADVHAPVGAVGRVGQGEASFRTVAPFNLDVKLPDELSAGDALLLPIVANATADATGEVALRAQLGSGLKLHAPVPERIALAHGRGRALLPVAAEPGTGSAQVRLIGKLGEATDRISRAVRIAPRGYPQQRASGGLVGQNAPTELVLQIPMASSPGSGSARLTLYPSPIAGLAAGLDGLLQEPHGCFEQASSANYPNTLVLALAEASGDNVPALTARARSLLPSGYAKITAFECSNRGYEWFGSNPGHEALTAYGLLQFHDMHGHANVDAAMVERTQNWLLARRDGVGGFSQSQLGLDSFGRAPQATTNAYVAYALLTCGTPAHELHRELEALIARLQVADTYELAAIACALHAGQRQQEAAQARNLLASRQQPDGSLGAATTSITRSGGKDLQVETAAFAVLAWLPASEHAGEVLRAVQFLHSKRTGRGTFGATQATVMALKALAAYAAQHQAARAPGTLRVFAQGRELTSGAFRADQDEPLQVDLWPLLASGEHRLQLQLDGGTSALPWTCEVLYRSEQPANDAACALQLTTQLRSTQVREGDAVALDVTLRNRTALPQPMAIARIGLPAGLELDPVSIAELQRGGAFAFWELRGREVALYWRELAANAEHTVTLDLFARIPGRSTGQAGRANLYYTPELVHWAAPIEIDVSPLQ